MIARAIKDINVFWSLVAIMIFNSLDAILTVVLIQQGLATEANPIMNEALSHGIFDFFLIKFSLVSLGCFGLWKARKKMFAKISIAACVFLYTVLLFYHAYGFYLGFF